ncbi:hypothetical protein BH23GEM6_BH23GEM6_18430 [soil metagenome]
MVRYSDRRSRETDAGSVEVTVQTSGIATNQERRDNHLRSSDFFDVVTFPTITFGSQRVDVSGDQVNVHGILTMKGVSRPVVLEGAFRGMGMDGQGRRRLGFEGSTTVNRHDYGVSWNNVVEGGGLVRGDAVTIQMAVSAVEQ